MLVGANRSAAPWVMSGEGGKMGQTRAGAVMIMLTPREEGGPADRCTGGEQQIGKEGEILESRRKIGVGGAVYSFGGHRKKCMMCIAYKSWEGG